MEIRKVYENDGSLSTVFLCSNFNNIVRDFFTSDEVSFMEENLVSEKSKFFHFNRFNRQLFVYIIENKNDKQETAEANRLAGNKIHGLITEFKIETICIHDFEESENALNFSEGLALTAYKFDKYKTEKKEGLKNILIHSEKPSELDIEILATTVEAVYKSRNLVNEQQAILDSETLAEEFKKMGEEAGFEVEVLTKKKIEALKMGGILAVNRGSVVEPTLTIMKYKPQNAINEKPIILVGKGVVYDTGGINIKTGDFMNGMKMDMAGAAAVGTAIWAIAKAGLPVYVISIVPATDNRPGGNAYVPGDFITMYNGKTVEVINTDAEGRLILADALSYAKKFDPQLVIDLATLTGSASRAIGIYGIAAMRNEESGYFEKLSLSGRNVYERLVEFPMWEEYGESIKSEFADLKNLGSVEGGLINAAKFLEHFVDYPWIHLDIAGPAMLFSKYNYRGIGGSGVGTRLLIDFLLNYSKNKY